MQLPLDSHSVSNTIQFVNWLASEWKFLAFVVTVIITAYKGFDWVKQIRTKDLAELHTSVGYVNSGITTLGAKIDNLSEKLETKLDSQTSAVVSELKEMRGDFRTFYISPVAQMMPARSKPVRKVTKRPVKKKITKVDLTLDAE